MPPRLIVEQKASATANSWLVVARSGSECDLVERGDVPPAQRHGAQRFRDGLD